MLSKDACTGANVHDSSFTTDSRTIYNKLDSLVVIIPAAFVVGLCFFGELSHFFQCPVGEFAEALIPPLPQHNRWRFTRARVGEVFRACFERQVLPEPA